MENTQRNCKTDPGFGAGGPVVDPGAEEYLNQPDGVLTEPETEPELTEEQMAEANEFLASNDRPHYLMQFFKFEHLPPHLRSVSRPFSKLASDIHSSLPDNPERTTALRKLLEAKDCAVRAQLFQ